MMPIPAMVYFINNPDNHWSGHGMVGPTYLKVGDALYNSYFYIEKWTFKIMCQVCYRVKRDKKEAT